jgi:hypothetical protein
MAGTIIFIFGIAEKSVKASYEVVIDAFRFAKKQFPIRFKITEDHVLASLLDPPQKGRDRSPRDHPTIEKL